MLIDKTIRMDMTNSLKRMKHSIVIYTDPKKGGDRVAMIKGTEKDWAGTKPYLVVVPNGHVYLEENQSQD